MRALSDTCHRAFSQLLNLCSLLCIIAARTVAGAAHAADVHLAKTSPQLVPAMRSSSPFLIVSNSLRSFASRWTSAWLFLQCGHR